LFYFAIAGQLDFNLEHSTDHFQTPALTNNLSDITVKCSGGRQPRA